MKDVSFDIDTVLDAWEYAESGRNVKQKTDFHYQIATEGKHAGKRYDPHSGVVSNAFGAYGFTGADPKRPGLLYRLLERYNLTLEDAHLLDYEQQRAFAREEFSPGGSYYQALAKCYSDPALAKRAANFTPEELAVMIPIGPGYVHNYLRTGKDSSPGGQLFSTWKSRTSSLGTRAKGLLGGLFVASDLVGNVSSTSPTAAIHEAWMAKYASGAAGFTDEAKSLMRNQSILARLKELTDAGNTKARDTDLILRIRQEARGL